MSRIFLGRGTTVTKIPEPPRCSYRISKEIYRKRVSGTLWNAYITCTERSKVNGICQHGCVRAPVVVSYAESYIIVPGRRVCMGGVLLIRSIAVTEIPEPGNCTCCIIGKLSR